MDKKNILISDANHGGLILLEEYSKYTQNNLFFYDIYNKLSENEKNNLEKKINVKFLTLEEILENEDSFVKINPIHMPPVIKTDFTHHEFVAYLLKKNNVNTKIIQVTGVKGKTTVTTFLKHVLKNFNTLVLTSDELTFNEKTLMKKLSITPASILTAINHAKKEKILDKIDYCIFEVSLGVVPNGYLNILTNILEDYPIANSSSSASIAKESVFSSKYTLCDYDSYHRFYNHHENVLTLSFDNKNANIYSSNVVYDIKNTTFDVNYFDKKYEFNHFALSDFYVKNLLFAISVGLIIKMDIKDIITNLKSSEKIEGRNSYKFINNKLIIEDINPGLNTTSIKKCVDNLKKFSENYLLIIGGDYGITCEEIDEEKLCEYLKNIDSEKIILTGELGYNIKQKLNETCLYFDNIKEAVKFCTKTNKMIIQIIYRSEYNSNIRYNLNNIQ